MRLIKITFLIVLFTLPLTVSAQVTITYGIMSVFAVNQDLNIQVTSKSFDIGSSEVGFRAFSDSNQKNEPILSFFSNRLVSGAKYNFTMTQEARGSIFVPTLSCQNFALTHPNQPLSTQFEISFADFRTPRYRKGSSEITTVNVPFTMTGRVSCIVSEDGQVIMTRVVNGTGSANLRFRSGTIWNRVYVGAAYYRYGASAPLIE